MAFALNPLSIILIFIISWACILCASSRSLHEPSSTITKQHEQWMAKYNKIYADSAEKQKRLQIFKDNLDFINKFNNEGNRTFKLALNAFSDLTDEEFRASYTGALYKPTTQLEGSSKNQFKYINVSLTEYEYGDYEQNLDWRERGAVDRVKTQRQCGSCWAFATTAVVEGAIKIKTGNPLVPLSEQQLLDCTNGCNPDIVYNTYDYIIQRGLASENQYYAYHASAGDCQDGDISSARISGYQTVPANDEEQLRMAVANQPVVVLIDSAGDGFRQYSSGIFSEYCGTNLDHYVAVVGYGVDETDGRKYWLIKNSWGESWGEGGYMRLLRDSGLAQGLCGITIQATYPVV